MAEAELRYGGVLARLHRAGAIEGGLGPRLAVDDQLRALAGRTLCRPCTGPWRHRATGAWWFALPLLAAGGLAAAGAAGRRAEAVLTTAAAGCLAAPYLFGIDYAAPRFLLPAYALLALPVAQGLPGLPGRVRPVLRPAAAAVLVLALAGHPAVQQAVLRGVVAGARTSSGDHARLAAALHRLGVRPPCLLTGDHAPPAAYCAGCASRQTGGHDASATPAAVLAAVRRLPVALLAAPGGLPPSCARGWRAAPVPDLRNLHGLQVLLPPGFRGRPPGPARASPAAADRAAASGTRAGPPPRAAGRTGPGRVRRPAPPAAAAASRGRVCGRSPASGRAARPAARRAGRPS
ncbi:hypothetical protein [Streptomyces sp. NPDC001380]|uniref:hypothetical protein n=1 Tax=Streptomyces sp. NPDC001380 TaxID=3364566 RepID=UPI00369DED23